MEDFAEFIIKYIEDVEIHGVKGWINQLNGYQWKKGSKIERFPDAMLITKKFMKASRDILSHSNNDDEWNSFCNDVRSWGGINAKVNIYKSSSLMKSTLFLLSNDPGIDSDLSSLPVFAERIATSSKIYYFSDPLKWTIYDSRVGYAIHQLICEYAKDRDVQPESLFQEITLCLPESAIGGRNPVFSVPGCFGSEIKAKKSFIWASHLHRVIANKLNETSIQKPSLHISEVPKWELPHVQMVFFVIGNRKWIDAPSINDQESPKPPNQRIKNSVGLCPVCGHPLVIRKSKKTGELYKGCTNFPNCKYKGNRSH